MARKLYCPTDKDVVLYIEEEEDKLIVRFMVAERPQTCRKCGKSYYKWECVESQDDK